MKHPILIDTEKCVGCGLCADDCVSHNLAVEDGKAKDLRFLCIACGHCEAICPQNAITLSGFEDVPDEIEKETRLDPDKLMRAIKTRRSIRKFLPQAIPSEIENAIFEAGRFSPTGANAQDVIYYVLDNQKDELEAIAVEHFRDMKAKNAGDPISARLQFKTLDDHFFFKEAPLVILIASRFPVDGTIAAENMALMAEANGLGVLYNGFFKSCVNTYPPLRERFPFPKGFEAVTTLVIGYPAVSYRRTVRREPANIVRL